MNRYEMLQKAFEDKKAALEAQLNLLAQAANHLVIGLGPYLGVPSPHWNHPDGRKGDQYVRLGVGVGKSFEEKRWMDLTAVDGVVEFAVSITVTSPSKTWGLASLNFAVSVQFTNYGYEFSIGESRQKVVLTAAEVEARQFDAVYIVLVQRLNSFFDPSTVLIKR